MPLDPTTNLTILCGDVIEQLRTLPDESVQCCMTSPPYLGLRSYLKAGDPRKVLEIGLEQTPQQYIDRMVGVFREVRRVLRSDGVLWLNLGSSFAGSGKGAWKNKNGGQKEVYIPDPMDPNVLVPKVPPGFKPKDLINIPHLVSEALRQDGWYLRQACPWVSRNKMPDSTGDRPTTMVEYIFLLTKNARYYYDGEAVKVPAAKGANGSRFNTGKTAKHQLGRSSDKPRVEDGRRARRSSDWFFESWQGMLQDEEGDPLAFVVNTRPYKGAHFACFSPELIRPCIQSGTSAHGCCPSCGKPFERIVETEGKTARDKAGERGWSEKADGKGLPKQGLDYAGGHGSNIRQTVTVGWRQACDCATYDPIPCTVLDPFAGSGTTGQVALEEGCRAVLIELNPDYIPLIHQRCGLVESQQESAA